MAGSLSNRFKAEIEQFFETAGFFAAADPKILGWCGVDEAEAHIRKNVIK